ncbi:hypothetical protein BC830DRAFT_1105267, partial [Chytriomyces sp. MP71]
MNRQSLTISSHSVVRDRDAWRNSPTTSSPVVPMPRPGPTSPTFPAHATLPSSQFIAHIPQRSFSADTRAILREQQRRDPWSVNSSNWSEFEGVEVVPTSHSLSLPRGGSSVHALFIDDFGPRTHSLELGRSQTGTLPQTQPSHWSHGNQSYDFDQDDDVDDGALIQSYDDAEPRSGKKGISLMRIGSKKGSKKAEPSVRSNNFPQSSFGSSSDLPKGRRHTLTASISRNPSKRSSEPRTEQIHAPDDGHVDPLSKRPWWSSPSRAPPKIVRARDILPRDPPPSLLARSLSLPAKPYQSERDRHSISGTVSGAGSKMGGKVYDGVASGITGVGGAIQGVGNKVLGKRRVKTDVVGRQEYVHEEYYEDGYATAGYVEDSGVDYYSPTTVTGVSTFRHSMSGAGDGGSGIGERISHGMGRFGAKLGSGVGATGELSAATKVGGKLVAAGSNSATGQGNILSKISSKTTSGTSGDRLSSNKAVGKIADISSSVGNGVSNAESKLTHSNVGGRFTGVGSNVASRVSSMGSKIAHSYVGEKIAGVGGNVATGATNVGSKIARSNVGGKIAGVSSSVATGVSNVGSKIASSSSGLGDKIAHSNVGAKVGGAGSSIATGISNVGSKFVSGVGSTGTKIGDLVRGKSGREE